MLYPMKEDPVWAPIQKCLFVCTWLSVSIKFNSAAQPATIFTKNTSMKTAILFASICIASGLLFVSLYTSLVDAPSWGSNLPGSVATARNYFKTVSPGTFLRLFSPVNQVLALLAVFLFWKASRQVRLYLGVAMVLYGLRHCRATEARQVKQSPLFLLSCSSLFRPTAVRPALRIRSATRGAEA